MADKEDTFHLVLGLAFIFIGLWIINHFVWEKQSKR